MGEIDKYDDVEREVEHVNATRKWLESKYKPCPIQKKECEYMMTDTLEIKKHTRCYCTQPILRRAMMCDS